MGECRRKGKAEITAEAFLRREGIHEGGDGDMEGKDRKKEGKRKD